MPRCRHHRLLVAVVALALVGSGCSDDDDATDDPTVQDDGGEDAGGATGEGEEGRGACGLLTIEQLEAAFGSPFAEGIPTEDETTGGQRCTWSPRAGAGEGFLLATYTDARLQAAFGQTAAQFFVLNREQIPIVEELDIGDEAFRTEVGVWVRDGADLYYLSNLGAGPEATAGTVALAEELVDG